MLGAFIVITVVLVAALLYIHFGYKSNADISDSDEYRAARRWKENATIIFVIIAMVLYFINFALWTWF